MGFPSLLVFFFVFHLFLLAFCDSNCPESFPCGNLTLEYPFTKFGLECGLIQIDCDSFPTPKIHEFGMECDVTSVDIGSHNFTVRDIILKHDLNSRICPPSSAPTFSIFPYISFTISSPNLRLFKCDQTLTDSTRVEQFFKGYENYLCGWQNFTLYYRNPADGNLPRETDHHLPLGCHSIQLPVNHDGNWSDDLFKMLTYDYIIQWHVSEYAPPDPTNEGAPHGEVLGRICFLSNNSWRGF